jgi:hypothetical protein
MSLMLTAEQFDDVCIEYRRRLNEIKNDNASDYFLLGKWAIENKLFGPAKLYLNRALELKPGYPEAKELLSSGVSGTLPDNYFEAVKECRKKAYEVEQKCANKLMDLAKYCKDKKLDKEKDFCLDEALKYEPDCRSAHEEKGEVRIDNFGWLPAISAGNIQKGLYEYKGKWLPKNEVEKLRIKWDDAWDFKSDHYLLKANIPFKKSLETLKNLEYLYNVFVNIFYGIEGFSAQNCRIFNVYYIKNLGEFISVTGQKDSLGYFNRFSRIAYVWEFEKNVNEIKQRGSTEQEILFHEGTHQLLELIMNSYNSPDAPNYWVVEGVACYFETLRNIRGTPVFGNRIARFFECKDNVNKRNYKHLKDFVKLNHDEIEADSANHAQALGLTLFFMKHKKYQLRFLEYIIKVYQTGGKLENNFEEFMRIDNIDTIEKEWIEFVKREM